MQNKLHKILYLVIVIDLILFIFIFSNIFYINQQLTITILTLITSIILTFQGIFTLIWMLHAWEDPEKIEKTQSPKIFKADSYSFTALIPARHEEKVIKDTIRAVDRIDYSDHLKEIIVICREDDKGTINKVREIIAELGKTSIKLEIFSDYPINKPHGLNYGLKSAKNEIITIFDAEDEPHQDIYKIINTVLIQDKVDVVQSGVQLMNYRSNWFSALNVMEYFLWFKSGLQFFLRIGNATTLGGNTVFFKKEWLKKIGGWDVDCLTEDADVGIRLIAKGAEVKVIYDEKHATQEETPTDIYSFIKQRTRWNQGFIQIFLKGDWLNLPKLRQKLVVLYILLSPLFQALLLIYTPIVVWNTLTQKMPILITLFSFIPLYIFWLEIIVNIVGLYEFTKVYKLVYPFWMPLKVLLTFYPYQITLMYSSFRAFYRLLFKKNSWEKTFHNNNHREIKNLSLLPKLNTENEYIK